VGTEGYASPTMDADEGLAHTVEINRIHRAGLGAISTTDTEVPPDYNPTAFALGIGPSGAGHGTGSGVTGQTGFCLETCG